MSNQDETPNIDKLNQALGVRETSNTGKKIFWAGIIVVLVIAYPWFYISLPIEGKVVDARTGLPIENAFVLGFWGLDANSFFHGYGIGTLYAAETRTNNKGEYKLPFWFRVPLRGRLYSYAPVIKIYNENYHVAGHGDSRIDAPFLLVTSDFDGKVVKLAPFNGTRHEYAEHLKYSVDDKVSGLQSQRKGMCFLKEMPAIIEALKKEQAGFDREGIKVRLSMSEFTGRNFARCT
ncbi:MAG: hypothetical protein OER98_10245 [Gammaproteobacteria bacterium]|nr:hypothetical protein [Gammaproteobacteria bacterium]